MPVADLLDRHDRLETIVATSHMSVGVARHTHEARRTAGTHGTSTWQMFRAGRRVGMSNMAAEKHGALEGEHEREEVVRRGATWKSDADDARRVAATTTMRSSTG